jgi:hypothetical protein
MDPAITAVAACHQPKPNATGYQPMMIRLKVRLPPKRIIPRFRGLEWRSSVGM